MKKTQASITMNETLDGFTVSFPRHAPGRVVAALFSYLEATYDPWEPVALDAAAGLGAGWESDAGILPAGTTFTLTNERTMAVGVTAPLDDLDAWRAIAEWLTRCLCTAHTVPPDVQIEDRLKTLAKIAEFTALDSEERELHYRWSQNRLNYTHHINAGMVDPFWLVSCVGGAGGGSGDGRSGHRVLAEDKLDDVLRFLTRCGFIPVPAAAR